MNVARVYGANDDLVEVDGAIEEEFGAHGCPLYLRFTNGVYLKAEYTKGGLWKIDILAGGETQLVMKTQEAKEDNGEDTDRGLPVYSDCIEIRDTLPIQIFLRSNEPIAKPDTPALIAGEVCTALMKKGLVDEEGSSRQLEVIQSVAAVLRRFIS